MFDSGRSYFLGRSHIRLAPKNVLPANMYSCYFWTIINMKILLDLQGYMLIQHIHTFTSSCKPRNHVRRTIKWFKRTFILATTSFTSLCVPFRVTIQWIRMLIKWDGNIIILITTFTRSVDSDLQMYHIALKHYLYCLDRSHFLKLYIVLFLFWIAKEYVHKPSTNRIMSWKT